MTKPKYPKTTRESVELDKWKIADPLEDAIKYLRKVKRILLKAGCSADSIKIEYEGGYFPEDSEHWFMYGVRDMTSEERKEARKRQREDEADRIVLAENHLVRLKKQLGHD